MLDVIEIANFAKYFFSGKSLSFLKICATDFRHLAQIIVSVWDYLKIYF